MPPPGFLNLTIDPDADPEDLGNEHLTVSKLIENIQAKNIKDTEKIEKIKDLCLKVNENIHHTGDRSFILDVLENGKQISAHHRRPFFSAGLTGQDIFGTLYVFLHKNEIIKITICDCNQSISEYDIVREIAMQKYASTLQETCNFKVPLIKNYGKIVLSTDKGNNCLYYFTMENISGKTLRQYLTIIDLDKTCTPLITKINEIYSCLIENNLFHNDYTSNNLIVDDKDMYVIDYGISTPIQEYFNTDDQFSCDDLKDEKANYVAYEESNKEYKKAIDEISEDELKHLITLLTPEKPKGGSPRKRRRTKKYYRKNKNTKTRRKK